jgi:hypothetical protein
MPPLCGFFFVLPVVYYRMTLRHAGFGAHLHYCRCVLVGTGGHIFVAFVLRSGPALGVPAAGKRG